MSLILDLSEDQQQARFDLREAIRQGERVLVLKGPAGTGKTTIVRVLTEDLEADGWQTTHLAPTGKAAVNFKDKISRPTSTIHGAMYRVVRDGTDDNPVFLEPKQLCNSHTVVFIDEASMVDADLDIEIQRQIPRGSVLVYIGDDEQLPPVFGAWGPNFENATAALTHVHRQEQDSTILDLATAVRNGGKLPAESLPPDYIRKPMGKTDIARWYIERQDAGDEVVVLGWTNKTRQAINKLVRYNRGFDQQGPMTPGDRLLVLYNNKLLERMNGEVLTVKEITPFSDTSHMHRAVRFGHRPTKAELASSYVEFTEGGGGFINPEFIGESVPDFREFTRRHIRVIHKDDWLHVDYGYAVTVHKSQGSEYDIVAFVIDNATRWRARQDPRQAARLVYTGITRAKKQLFVFDVR